MQCLQHFDFSNLQVSPKMGDLSGESGLETRPPLFIVGSLPCSRWDSIRTRRQPPGRPSILLHPPSPA